MSKKSQTKKGRQSAAHRLPPSKLLASLSTHLNATSSTRSTKKTTSSSTKTKKRAKKTSSKHWLVFWKPQTPTAKKSTAKASKANSRTKARRKRQFKVLLTHSTQLVITIQPVRKQQRKKQVTRQYQTWPYISFNRGTALTLLLIAAGLLGTAYFGWHTVFASPATPPPVAVKGTVPAATHIGSDAKRTHYPKSQPTHLTISAIDVNTTVSTVGKNPDGSITVPADYRTAGWYQYSPTPGEIGPSVIVGHLDNVSGIAVFWRLHELVPGNMIQVARADGRTLQFKVDSVKQFPQNAFPDKEVYGNIDYAGLRLITCGGTFNRLTHHYDQNTVVYASLAN